MILQQNFKLLYSAIKGAGEHNIGNLPNVTVSSIIITHTVKPNKSSMFHSYIALTIFLCSLDAEIDDHHRNPNIDNRSSRWVTN